ncbi:family 2 glycosyl transferase [Ligilactobacillus pabuli]|uniref:Family 2 glycosyl transferase n=1 Tax=Ligilactobacillus pabuli TaxID=2886039 RepID=A0ABQ5JN18_9LACO|nr:glycosyltransferase [Ligilactobacillus pabuli]GKS82319.1 family 2 glycosyl transferase [Ligilactobacillus pabuli]
MEEKNSIRLSIIIPVYNVKEYLSTCLESIISQDLSNVEVLLINDGSTDNSDQICLEYCKRDKHFLFFNKQNGGLSDARNYGISKARGTYLQFVDSDDVLLKHAIRIIKRIVGQSKTDVLKINFKRFQEDKNELLVNDNSMNIQVVKSEELVEDIFYNRTQSYTWSYIVKKSIFIDNDIFFPIGRNYEDMATTCKLLIKAKNAVLVDNQMYGYRNRENSISNSSNAKNALDIVNNLSSVENFFELLPINIYDSGYINFELYYLLLAFQESGYKSFRIKRKIIDEYNNHSKKVSIRYRVAYYSVRLGLYKTIQKFRKKIASLK